MSTKVSNVLYIKGPKATITRALNALDEGEFNLTLACPPISIAAYDAQKAWGCPEQPIVTHYEATLEEATWEFVSERNIRPFIIKFAKRFKSLYISYAYDSTKTIAYGPKHVGVFVYEDGVGSFTLAKNTEEEVFTYLETLLAAPKEATA